VYSSIIRSKIYYLVLLIKLSFVLLMPVNYHALTDVASRFIDTLTCGILFKYSNIAEAFLSLGVSPKFHRQSPFGN